MAPPHMLPTSNHNGRFAPKVRNRRRSTQLRRTLSSPLPRTAASSSQSPASYPFSFVFDIGYRSIQDAPLLHEPVTAIRDLEGEILAKNPPGQWFRKIPNKRTDITCLPVEIHIEILSRVCFLDQLACERVCSTWRTIIQRDCMMFRYTSIDDSAWTGIKPENVAAAAAAAAAAGPWPIRLPGVPPEMVTVLCSEEGMYHHISRCNGKLLIHRFIQDGNFAFRQIPHSQCVEIMSTYTPAHPHQPPRRFKIANLSFLDDPVAIYISTTDERDIIFQTIHEVPYLCVEFDSEPLRSEFELCIGGDPYTASSVANVELTLPTPFPGSRPRPRNKAWEDPGGTRELMAQGMLPEFDRLWNVGTFLLAVQGKLESEKHWYEDSALEQNERWNGRGFDQKFLTGVDYHGDWDMDAGFRQPLTLVKIAEKERELLALYQRNGFWYMRDWRKDKDMAKMHVALTPVSEWVWEICY
ncbi:hypothetical protein DRE_00242 [Drechslerella stenobrocha 248]|uniref:F-box domain-containing protein n=1 Tax=Drechslerella stenobrocha 248 TaxID=1043628 RepID=W7I9Z0_9PEZI|nr:hypothetical protein DRE_00242 [Drechslerella stenobrocha 248]